MTATDALFISKSGIPDADDAMRIETGETHYVWSEPFYHEVASLEAATAYLESVEAITDRIEPEDLPGGYWLTRQNYADHPIVVGEEVTGYRLRMAQSVEAPKVEGGHQIDPTEDLGDFNLYRVRCKDTGLTALHTATQEVNDGAGGALMMQDGSSYPNLPTTGQPVTTGVIYNDNGDLVVARQSHTRTEHDVADIPALFAVWRSGASGDLDWVAQESVEVGMRRLYDGVLYECIQAHQTQDDWTPDATPALWAEVVEAGTDWTVGEAVQIGDQRWYNDVLYECLQAHTTQATWTPDVTPALWQVVE